MEKVIKFFLTKARLNYTLFIFLILFGIISYQMIPKDVFPPIKIDKIIVSGDYAGTSVENLDKMVVINLEKEIKALNGVKKVESYIKDSAFTIVATLESHSNKSSILDKVKDIISNNKSDLPEDMDEPIASLVDWSYSFINITIASNIVKKDNLIKIADKIKTKISSIPNISKVQLLENTTKTFEIILNNKVMDLYNLNKEEVFKQIQQLSYIYPLGKIEDNKEHIFLSTNNGKKKVEEYINTKLQIDGKILYLSDIAKVKEKYKEVDIITKLNGKKNITLYIEKNEKANVIALSKEIKKEVKVFDKEYKDVNINTYYDTSIYIKNRLNTIISGIMFGLILVTVALYLLINKRVAFIVVLGIPIAILLGVSILSLTSYSINMITLIGALLILGVLVDDAVIIAENIQRHIVKGENKLEATITGAKEVFLPVFASSLTTILAFAPMMMLTGEIGELLKLIPVVVIILVTTSLLESFVFLPLHAYHSLNKEDKELDWTKAQEFYSKILHKVIHYRKSFLTIFIIIIPSLTVLMIMLMKYQLFPTYDSDKIFIRGKVTNNHTVNQTYDEIKEIEKILLKNKKKLALKTIDFTVGYRNGEDDDELKQSVFQFIIELENRVPQNFVDGYITPILSLSDEKIKKIRVKSVDETIETINKLLKSAKPKDLLDFSIKKEGSGVTKNDIEILLNTKNKKLLLEAIKDIKKGLKKQKGVTFVDDTAKLGIKELKLKINSYGESLGFNEVNLAQNLSPLYLKAEQAKGLNNDGIFKIISYDKDKNKFDSLSNLEINIPNTQKEVALSEICDYRYVNNFDSITKINGVDTKKVLSNVNMDVLTAQEAIDKIKPILDKYRKKGVKISFEGEAEQNDKMAKELSLSFFVAIFMIFIVLLIMFNSFRQTFIVLSIIPFSIMGAILGHLIIGLNLSLPSIIGILGLAGVVINDAIVMLDFIKNSRSLEDMMNRAKLRLRPIIITSITTFLGLSTLIFFATGQSKILQPIAISLGFGLIWGTVLTLIYLPALFAVSYKMRKE